MDSQLVTHSNVHHLRRCLPFITCTYSSNGNFFNHIAIIDGGATRTTFPIARLPHVMKQYIKPTDVTLTGVGGKCSLAGTLTCKVFLGAADKVGYDVDILITTSGIPALIGQDILSNGNISSFTQDNKKGCIRFEHTDGNARGWYVKTACSMRGSAKVSLAVLL